MRSSSDHRDGAPRTRSRQCVSPCDVASVHRSMTVDSQSLDGTPLHQRSCVLFDHVGQWNSSVWVEDFDGNMKEGLLVDLLDRSSKAESF